MKRAFLTTGLIFGLWFAGCQKQQSDEERRAEIERQVQQRLAAERQQELDRREADLKAREQSLNTTAGEASVAQVTEPSRSNETEVPQGSSAADRQPAGSYSIFYDKLEPYGDWVETTDYGYVYRPREAADSRWRPYTNGRWAYTDAGWTWISEEPFGWATYHYGRWTRLRGIGWVWVPGSEWAPAWVSWRKGSEYVGWAPLPPEAGFDRRRGIHNWSDSYYDVGPDQYVFVPVQQFGEERIESAILPEQQVVTIVNQTTNVTNITYNNTLVVNQGPGYDELRQQSRIPIPRLRLERQASVAVNEPRPIVRGDVVQIPAPVIASTRPTDRPRSVKQKLAQTAADLGWGAINNPQQAEQARAKIKAEASPPADAPRKIPVSRERTDVSSPAASRPATGVAESRTNSTPAAPAAQPVQTAFPAATQVPAAAAGSPVSATPASSPAPAMPVLRRSQRERALPSPGSSPASPFPTGNSTDRRDAISQPAVTGPSAGTASPESAVPPQQRKRFKSAARQFEKQSTVPMPAASATAGAASSAPPAPVSSPDLRANEPRDASTQPAVSASASPTTGNASGLPPNLRKDRQERQTRAGGAKSATPFSSATPTP